MGLFCPVGTRERKLSPVPECYTEIRVYSDRPKWWYLLSTSDKLHSCPAETRLDKVFFFTRDLQNDRSWYSDCMGGETSQFVRGDIRVGFWCYWFEKIWYLWAGDEYTWSLLSCCFEIPPSAHWLWGAVWSSAHKYVVLQPRGTEKDFSRLVPKWSFGHYVYSFEHAKLSGPNIPSHYWFRGQR